jgi:methylenetetrahydrofolate dehydrogenase (NADP+)/methenyltetrahydrofolate cyclohydrolase
MKLLSGIELVGFIKERQAHQVRGLRQHDGIVPKLAIIQTIDNPVIDTYVRLKQAYAADILVDVDVHKVTVDEAAGLVDKLNNDQLVTGIIIQLPLSDTSRTDELVTKVASQKDVDGLGSDEFFTPATAMAIDWLVNGHNIDLGAKKVAIVGGHGRLVGRPLMKLWAKYGPTEFNSGDDLNELKNYDLIVSATGSPALIKPDMVTIGATVIDAGTSSEGGKIVGDASPELFDRNDISITPPKGGVGPLTIAALLDNVIRAARLQSHNES